MAITDRSVDQSMPSVVFAKRAPRPDEFVLLQRSALAQRMNAARAEGERLAAVSASYRFPP